MRISPLNHSRVGLFKISLLVLSVYSRCSINQGIAFFQRQVLDGTPTQEVAHRQTILSQGVKCSLVQGQQRRRLERHRIKLALQVLEKFPLAETVAARECANRAILVRKFHASFFDDIERESWIADMIDRITLL